MVTSTCYHGANKFSGDGLIRVTYTGFKLEGLSIATNLAADKAGSRFRQGSPARLGNLTVSGASSSSEIRGFYYKAKLYSVPHEVVEVAHHLLYSDAFDGEADVESGPVRAHDWLYKSRFSSSSELGLLFQFGFCAAAHQTERLLLRQAKAAKVDCFNQRSKTP